MQEKFCRLGFVTEHSLMRSAIKVSALEKLDINIPLAAPDFNNMSNIIRLHKKRKNIIPSITLTITHDYSNKYRSYDRIRIYAYSNEAYVALCEAATKATQNFYYEPRLSIDDLKILLASSNDIYGIIDEDFPFIDNLNENCFIAVNAFSTLSNNAYLKLKPIFFYESLFLNKDDVKVYQILISYDEKENLKVVSDRESRSYYTNQEHYNFALIVPEAIENYNTLLYKEVKNDTIKYGDKLPVFSDNDIELFTALTKAGFAKRYPNPSKIHIDRLNFEIDTIIKMGFPAYFLIVWDFIDWMKRNDIPVGPGRGSAAGSIVSYCLSITEICPIEHGLFFERFLNPDRISMPDIDIDISKDQRKKVIDYLTLRYGKERVSQIVNFMLKKSKTAFKDACRISGIEPSEAERLTKLWPPSKFGVTPTLDEVSKFEKITNWINSSNKNKEIWSKALLVENFIRQEGVHAAGVIISPTKMTNYIPVTWKKDDERLCQLNMIDAESYGLLKMDLLGLKTMDILHNACKLSKINFSILYNLPLDDKKVYERFRAGDTHGVFQFESKGMQDMLRRMQPTRFDDIAAANALYRPGPLQAGLAEQYIKNKINGITEHFIPAFESLLSDTYEVLVYQEQIMKISQSLAGFSMAKADNLRKAIGKKDKEKMKSLKDDFVNGATNNGHNHEKMIQLWDMIEGFGDYCFNKSHSAAYALIAYCCMWLKVHHPQEFALALLNSDMGDSKTMSGHFYHFKESVSFEYPKMNHCNSDFSIEDSKVIIGLNTVKELGDSSPFTLKFKDLDDFLESSKLDKTKLTQLIKCGFFDDLEYTRDVMLGNVEEMLKYSKNAKISKTELMFDLFLNNGYIMQHHMRKHSDRLRDEQDAYGFYIKEGFIIKYGSLIKTLSPTNIVGSILNIKRTKTKAKQEDMAILSVLTPNGEINVIVFPKIYSLKGLDLFEDKTYIFDITISPPRDEYDESYILNDFIEAVNFTPTKVELYDMNGFNRETYQQIGVNVEGKIPIEYSGNENDNLRTKSLGYIDVFNNEYIKSLPSQLKITSHIFN